MTVIPWDQNWSRYQELNLGFPVPNGARYRNALPGYVSASGDLTRIRAITGPY